MPFQLLGDEAMAAQPEIKTGKKTIEDWLALDELDGNFELIDGELIRLGGNRENDMPGALPKHATTTSRLMLKIDKLKPNGEVLTAPVGVYFDDENTPEPDVFWIKEGGRCKMGEQYFEGAPDLIVEVLSRGTAHVDRNAKFKLYEKYGVTEYWIADSEKKLVSVYSWQDQKYHLLGTFTDKGAFDSPVLGARVELTGVFA